MQLISTTSAFFKRKSIFILLVLNVALVLFNLELLLILSKKRDASAKTEKKDRTSMQVVVYSSTSSSRVQSLTPEIKRPQSDYEMEREKLIAELKLALADSDERQLLESFVSDRIGPKYQRLFTMLKLDLAKREALLGLLASKDLKSIECYLQQANDPSADAKASLIATQRAEDNQAILALVGDDALKVYTEYERTVPIRNALDRIDRRLSYTSAPLTSDQYEQVVKVLASEPQYQKQLSTPGNTQAVLGDIAVRLNEDTLSKIRPILNEKQFAQYEKQVKQDARAQLMADRRLKVIK